MARLENGQFDPNYLVPLTSQGDYLVVMAASQWIGYAGRQWIAAGLYDNLLAAAREFKRRRGKALVITECFRSLATQREFRRRYLNGTGNYAALPGTSNHGLGIAVDLGSGIGYGGDDYAVWAEIAAVYGWSNVEGMGVGERWHWTGVAKIVGAGGTTITPIGEDDELNSEEKNQLKFLYEVMVGAGPVNNGIPLVQQIAGAYRDSATAMRLAEAAAIDAYAARKAAEAAAVDSHAARVLSQSVFDATFYGGDSMPDKIEPGGVKGYSIGQSLADLRRGIASLAAKTTTKN